MVALRMDPTPLKASRLLFREKYMVKLVSALLTWHQPGQLLFARLVLKGILELSSTPIALGQSLERPGHDGVQILLAQGCN